MRGPLQRIRTARGHRDDAAGTVREEPASSIAEEGPDDGAGPDPRSPLPAGVAPEELIGDPPDTRRRGKLRRRLRHLRQVRELMLRDVGGLVYEFHRAGAGSGQGEPGAALVGRKLDRLAALDAERRELEDRLDDRRDEVVMREAGVGGACLSCGEYFASDARFCAHCGVPVDRQGRGADAAPSDGGAAAERATMPSGGPTSAQAQAHGADRAAAAGARSVRADGIAP